MNNQTVTLTIAAKRTPDANVIAGSFQLKLPYEVGKIELPEIAFTITDFQTEEPVIILQGKTHDLLLINSIIRLTGDAQRFANLVIPPIFDTIDVLAADRRKTGRSLENFQFFSQDVDRKLWEVKEIVNLQVSCADIDVIRRVMNNTE